MAYRSAAGFELSVDAFEDVVERLVLLDSLGPSGAD